MRAAVGLQGPQTRGALVKAEPRTGTLHGSDPSTARSPGLSQPVPGGDVLAVARLRSARVLEPAPDLKPTGAFPSESAGRLPARKDGLGLASGEGQGIGTEHTHRCHLAVFAVAVNLRRGFGLNLATSRLGGKSTR